MVGDPIGKTYTPYAGIRLTGRRCCGKDPCGNPLTKLDYKWRLIGSLISWNRWRFPLNINCSSPTLVETSRTLYSMDASQGYFLETEGKVFVPFFPRWDLFAWAAASWLDLNGKGTIVATTVPGLASAPATDIFGGLPGSGSIDDATYRRSYYAIGIGFRWTM